LCVPGLRGFLQRLGQIVKLDVVRVPLRRVRPRGAHQSLQRNEVTSAFAQEAITVWETDRVDGLAALSSGQRQSMARLLTVTGRFALVAVLFTGCGGGGDDRAKVEASLRNYLATVVPEETAFPIGAGLPRVMDNGCKDRHVKTGNGPVLWLRSLNHPGPNGRARVPDGLALWSCVVRFARVASPVLVAVDDTTEVVWATPMTSASTPPPSPPRTYTSH